MSTRRYGNYVFESSNEDKVLFPSSGTTKGALIDYYDRIAPYLLPHLKDRPLVLQRFPDGVEEGGFYQKQIGDYFPDWISRVSVEVQSTGARQELVVCNNQATLAYLANQACVTLHPWLSRAKRLHRPDQLIVDFDPPEDDFEKARHGALELKSLLDDLGIRSFPKLTGSKGIHVHVPLDRSASFDEVREIADSMMKKLVTRDPQSFTTEQRKEKRKGRLFLDIARNAYAQTAVAAYSVRARPSAPVAAPVAWQELEVRSLESDSFTIDNVFQRLGQKEDPWAGWRRHARSADSVRRRLDALRG